MNGIPKTVVSAVLLLSAALAQAATPPDEFVTDAIRELSAKLDGRQDDLASDPESLYALIEGVLLPRFDRRLAAQQVLAKHWKTASAEQQDRFVDAFYTTLLQRYADGILDFEHDRIQVLPFRGDVTKRTVVVKTRVDLEDGSNVSVNYTLVGHDDGWMMFDVMIEGVSYVRNFRAEFDAEIRATGLEQVIVRLKSEAKSGSGE
ncbi:MAG: ABC transporter substrate-binding protein [Proteobacteria bacterium]|nr:ABC transporter substrate-binding protein [Pseudomonadota bacterium]MDA1064096.1 ABC transporter substrate-binding protein [Pseudomonadota bacterium]